MLSNVTWTEYLIGVVVVTVAYYLFVAFKYKADVKKIFSGKFKENSNSSFEEETAVTEDGSSIDELEAVVQDLRYAILEKAGKSASKEELLEMLQQRLANYNGLRKPAFRVAINNYLIQYAKEICGVVLSEGELERIWKALLR